jgi:hypothetical protein
MRLIRHLESTEAILLLATSSRYEQHSWAVPKTTQLALRVRDHLRQGGRRVTQLDVSKLRIHTCEGSIGGGRGNHCGMAEARLPDRSKNPTGHHRCWASINNQDYQLCVEAPAALSSAWQYATDPADESPASYLDAIREFGVDLKTGLLR